MDASVAVLGSRGRITVPLDVRRALALQPGARLVFVQVSPGRYEVKAEMSNERGYQHPNQLDLGLQQ